MMTASKPAREFSLCQRKRAGMAEDVLDDMEGVLVAIGGGELQDGEVHLIDFQ